MKPIILVCGFGRCGSSMIMQMLRAAGVELYGDPDPPVYEAPEAAELPGNHEWLRDAVGMAVKVLSPEIYTIPVLPHGYSLPSMRAIWLDRDLPEQARSLCKLRKYAPTRPTRKRFEKELARNRGAALAALNRVCYEPPLLLHFERILADPRTTAFVMAAWLGIEDAEKVLAMASTVLQRGAKAQRGWTIEQLNKGLGRRYG